jgi:glycosyltransferase involved in cell wall biosynthesis
MDSLSGYVLTYNSQKYLEHVLSKMSEVCDEMIIVDSGSSDRTIEIAKKYHAMVLHKSFEDYTSQRTFAHSQCRFPWIFWMDSDEIPSQEMILWIKNQKKNGFQHPIYSFVRNNYVLGRRVGVVYPVYDPEFRERLCNQSVRYDPTLKVHENLDSLVLRTPVHCSFDHFTMETPQEIETKLIRYATLYASQLSKKPKWNKLIFSPIAAWIKWYLIKGGWKDGSVGFKLGLYAFRFTYLKYFFARK